MHYRIHSGVPDFSSAQMGAEVCRAFFTDMFGIRCLTLYINFILVGISANSWSCYIDWIRSKREWGWRWVAACGLEEGDFGVE